MFSKKNRLSAKEFSEIMKEKGGYSSPYLYAKVVKNSVGHIRTGVGVSKGLATKIARKNYYKRILKHILKNVLSDVAVSYDVIIVAKESAGNKKFKELEEDAKNLLQKTPLFSK